MVNRFKNKSDLNDDKYAKWAVYFPSGGAKIGGRLVENRKLATAILTSLETAAKIDVNIIILAIGKLGKGWEVHALPIQKVTHGL